MKTAILLIYISLSHPTQVDMENMTIISPIRSYQACAENGKDLAEAKLAMYTDLLRSGYQIKEFRYERHEQSPKTML